MRTIITKSFTSVLCQLIISLSVCATEMPKQWIDAETGHRVVRITDIPYSTIPYFTHNIFSPDQQHAAYQSPKGIHLLDLDTWKSQTLIDRSAGELAIIGFSRKLPRLYYLVRPPGSRMQSFESINTSTRKVTRHAELKPNIRVESINSTDTLAACVFEEERISPPQQPRKKAEILYSRYKEAIPMGLCTIDIETGKLISIYESKEWLSHPQYSPVDPDLLMYSIEGPWHEVDRIWTIQSDGSNRKLMLKRTMPMEIAGHEFWSNDGQHIVFDWQTPKGKDFRIGMVDRSGAASAFQLRADQWSVHFNTTLHPDTFVGDGANRLQVAKSATSAYIMLYQIRRSKGEKATEVKEKRLVDLNAHDYTLEPNARATPDGKWVIFRTNMFGYPELMAVETAVPSVLSLPVRRTSHMAGAAAATYNRIMLRN